MIGSNDRGPWGAEEKKKESPQPQQPPNHDNKNSSSSFQSPHFKGLEDFVKNFQRTMRGLPFFSNKGNRGLLLIVAMGFSLIWIGTGVYGVQPNEQGVVLRFGKMVRIAQPGLNYHLPRPIEHVIIKDVTAVNRIDSGHILSRDAQEENLMLTGDENIVEVNFAVLWLIKDIKQYLFNAKSPEETIKSGAESVVREIIAQTPIASALTQGRGLINQTAQHHLQKLVDDYGLGIHIQDVLMGKIDPPAAVIDSYRDVQRAKADQDRAKNEGEAYKNSIVPIARGEAQKIIQHAMGYRKRTISVAEGEAQRFEKLLFEYNLNPQVLSKRLYVNSLKKTLTGLPKVIVEPSQQMLSYLPLPSVQKMISLKPTTNTQEASHE